MENKKVILVVDDELDFLKMIRMRLETSGYAVITAINGKEALEKVRDYKLDAVLLDVLMPGMNGLEVLKKIRQDNKDIPVFIITAFSTEDRFELAEKFSASGFIVKTSDLKKEVDNITSFLRLSGKYKS